MIYIYLIYYFKKIDLLFIDRDGEQFKFVLQFLRVGNLHLNKIDHMLNNNPIEYLDLLRLILDEAIYYGIKPLVYSVQNELRTFEMRN